MKRFAYMLVAISSVALVACTVRSVSVGYYDDSPRRHHDVYVDHVCSHDCHDHYWDGHRVVVIGSGHRHHRGCGHHWNGRHWVVVHDHHGYDDHADVVIHKAPAHRISEPPRRVKRVTHVHGPSCGCAWDRRDGVWVTLETGHVHGRNCGHIHVNGKWCLSR